MALHGLIPIYIKSENAFSPSPPPLNPSLSNRHLLSNIIIATVSLFSAILFLSLTYYTVLSRRRHRRAVTVTPTVNPQDDEADHIPIWHVNVNTVGLDDTAINSISPKPYVAGGGAAAECAVCLGDFCDGEIVRFLPACGHPFHVFCIDTWLRDHISCPVCRANFVSVVEEVEEDDVSLDSFVTADLSSRLDLEGRFEGSWSGEHREKKRLDFGESTSGSGRMFFFSKYGRSRSSSVLPM